MGVLFHFISIILFSCFMDGWGAQFFFISRSVEFYVVVAVGSLWFVVLALETLTPFLLPFSSGCFLLINID